MAHPDDLTGGPLPGNFAEAVAAAEISGTVVRVNLTAKSARAVEVVADLTGDTKTDVINRAIQTYLILVETAHDGSPDVATGLRGIGNYDLYITRFLRR